MHRNKKHGPNCKLFLLSQQGRAAGGWQQGRGGSPLSAAMTWLSMKAGLP
jgi:hypothetical protein